MIVQCSWKVSDGRPISDTVVSSVESENADLEDEITVENCVMLEAPESEAGMYPTVPACQLLISCEPPNEISRISVLCEARVIEVYGHHGEYLKTVKNTLLEEAEDMVVFSGDAALDRPSSICSIKFLHLRSPSEMWLYGVKIHTIKVPQDTQNNMTVPLAAVEQRLGEMGLVLSDKAEAFKKLIQNCQKSSMDNLDNGDLFAYLLANNLVKNKSPSPDNNNLQLLEMMKLLPNQTARQDNLNNVKDTIYTMTDMAIGGSSNNLHGATSASTSPVIFERASTSTQTEEDYLNLETKLKALVAEQLEESERKMWEKINQRFQETEAKIMCKLDEIESFVKPQGVSSN